MSHAVILPQVARFGELKIVMILGYGKWTTMKVLLSIHSCISRKKIEDSAFRKLTQGQNPSILTHEFLRTRVNELFQTNVCTYVANVVQFNSDYPMD